MFSRNLLSRRSFIALAGAAGAGSLAACSKPDAPKADTETPVEILSRQHGVIYRAVAILEEIRGGMDARMDLPPEIISGTLGVVRPFMIEHYQMEEKHIYPVFEAAGKMNGMIGVLREQHAAGSRLIEIMTELCGGFSAKDLEKRRTMGSAMHLFSRMCRAHAEREDTELSPQLRRLMVPKSYADLISTFQKAETELLGQNGFDETIHKLANYENTLGIGDLASFTPHAEELR